MSYWIVYILRFPLLCDLPACHIGALKMKKIESQALHYTSTEEIYVLGFEDDYQFKVTDVH